MDRPKLKKTMDKCNNKPNCNVEWTPSNILDKKFDYDPNGQCGDHASLFIQYRCLISNEDFDIR